VKALIGVHRIDFRGRCDRLTNGYCCLGQDAAADLEGVRAAFMLTYWTVPDVVGFAVVDESMTPEDSNDRSRSPTFRYPDTMTQ
jgi:hypothetical protein